VRRGYNVALSVFFGTPHPTHRTITRAAALATLLVRRERVLRWITQSDGQQGIERVGSGDDGWTAFLKEHPELTDR
jgi:hypothetical protein